MAKATQRDSSKYKVDVTRATKKEQGNSEETLVYSLMVTIIMIKVLVPRTFKYIISINPDRQECRDEKS